MSTDRESTSQHDDRTEDQRGGKKNRSDSVATQPDQKQGFQSRIGGAWTAVAVAAIVLLLLLIFILQNQKQVSVTFFGGTGQLPLGVLVLLAAVGGALLVVVLGVARIIQLKALARRQLKASKGRRR